MHEITPEIANEKVTRPQATNLKINTHLAIAGSRSIHFQHANTRESNRYIRSWLQQLLQWLVLFNRYPSSSNTPSRLSPNTQHNEPTGRPIIKWKPSIFSLPAHMVRLKQRKKNNKNINSNAGGNVKSITPEPGIRKRSAPLLLRLLLAYIVQNCSSRATYYSSKTPTTPFPLLPSLPLLYPTWDRRRWIHFFA